MKFQNCNTHKVILILLLSSTFLLTKAQAVLEYPINLQTDTLFVPLLDLYPLPKLLPKTNQQKKEYDNVIKQNKQITKANNTIIKTLNDNYPFPFKTVSLDKTSHLPKGKFVLESFSQLNKKMAYYYKDNLVLLEELLDESGAIPHTFNDVYLYYYVVLNKTEKEYIMVDFGKKNIPQALRYFCRSVTAFFEEE